VGEFAELTRQKRRPHLRGRFEIGLSGVQFLQQQLGLLQVERSKSFGEPAMIGARRSRASPCLFCLHQRRAKLLILLFWTRKSPIQTWLALVASTFVLGYVLIRAASFHHIDHFIGGRVLGFKWNWILEITGIAIVLLASEWRRASVFRLLNL